MEESLKFVKDEVYREAFGDHKGNMYLARVIRFNEKEYDASIYKMIKEDDKLKLSEDMAGLCIWEIKDEKTVETLYSVEEEYRGTGLGSKLVEFSKDFAKKLGKNQIKLSRINRQIPYAINKNETIDGNLLLYLKHGF